MLNKLLLLLFSAITLIEWLAFLYCILRSARMSLGQWTWRIHARTMGAKLLYI